MSFKNTVKPILVLTLICLAVALLLAVVNYVASPVIAEVTEAAKTGTGAPITYAYYHANTKPKPKKEEQKKKGFICNICGYIYEGDELPADFICPICKHPASDVSPLE